MHSLSCGRSLNNNQIGEQGATAIAEALKVNGALTMLQLCANNIGDAGKSTLRAAQKPSLTLRL